MAVAGCVLVARDFRHDLAAAVTTNDVAGIIALAYQLLGKVEHDEERRARLAEKKRLERESRNVARQGAMSPTSEMSRNVAGRRETGRDVADGVPSPEKILTTNPPPARETRAIAAVDDPKLAATLNLVRTASGESWTDVEAFMLRRSYATWQGWADEMLRVVGGASQFTWEDMATVCRDDATLDKKLGSAFVLRKFLAPVRQERLEALRSPPGTAARPGSPSRRDSKPAPQRYEYSEGTDPEKIKWQP